MAVKIVTDSGSDLPEKIVRELGITVVPVYIYFGDKAYKDGVDLSPDELYKRLEEGSVHPTTTQPIPADFANVYKELSHVTDQIVSIHLPAKVSGTYNSALQGKEISHIMCNINVIDSLAISMGLALVALPLITWLGMNSDLGTIMAVILGLVIGIKFLPTARASWAKAESKKDEFFFDDRQRDR